MTPHRRATVVGLLILLASGVVWFPAIFNDFVDWDDLTLIISNPHFNPPTFNSFCWYWTHAFFTLYMPITCNLWLMLAKLGWAENADQFGGHLNPYLFHLASVILHSLGSLVVFVILRRATRNDWAAAMGAMVFAIHPIQTEAIAFAGAMNNPLFGLFSLLAIWQYLCFRENGNRKAYAIGSICFIAAILSKPTAVVVPAIAMTLDWSLNRRSWKSTIVPILPWLVLIVPCVLWTRFLQHGLGTEPVAWSNRSLVASDAVAFYLVKLVAPVKLTIDYGRSIQYVLASNTKFLSCIAVIGLIVIAGILGKFDRRIVASMAIFLIALLPTSGIVLFNQQSVSTVTDRYVYLSMLGPSLLVAVILTRLNRVWITRAFAVIVVALAVRTQIQIKIWRNGETLFRHAIAVNPNSWLAYGNLAYVISDSSPAEAIDDCQIAIRLNPNFAMAYNNLGSILMDQGKIQEAKSAFESAHRLDPSHPLFEANYNRSHAVPARH